MLKLEVVTPQKKALETEVDSVTLPGSEGELGILARPHSLVNNSGYRDRQLHQRISKTNPSGSLGLCSG